MTEALDRNPWTVDDTYGASAGEISPVTKTVIAAIAESTDANEARVQPDVRLVDLAADNLDVIHLMILLEDAFDIEFPASAGLGLDPTCGQIVTLVQRMIAERDGARP